MKLHRTYAIVLRYLYLFRRSFDRLSDAFYWPTIDLLLWGLTSVYFRTYIPNASTLIIMMVSGILFWIIVWRGQYEITVNLLEDLWNENLINIFVAPISFAEWVLAFVVIGVIKALVSFGFAMVVAFLLYRVKLFFFGWYFVPLIGLLIMTGWAVGFFVAGLILRFGTKIQTFAWTMVAVISPFSAIYYPVSVLPGWAQAVARVIPTSYVFEEARRVINRGTLDYRQLGISLALNLVYLTVGLVFLYRSFKAALNRGLVKVY
ncbi:ABC transporter permease [Patescibacteria group bacterium]|nr:ABC transporter permease [Patescibacteria group bacterium]MCL5091911.1 ABC transporter permease [Patescibacteria group bacterium]